jgi:aryl-alcohol dehydrogenase-like predicted oxidoreductase
MGGEIMQYRRLGRTGLGVSPICLGTMGFGPPTTQDQVDAIVGAALDMGINFIDTANCYDGPGRGEMVLSTSETMLGAALGDRRDDVVLLTKAGVPLRPGPQHRGLSATHLLREIDASLRRLRTDYVDIFMIHWPDAYADIEEVLRAVDQIVRSGRARHFGISNHLGWQVCEYLWEADKRSWPKVSVSEISLSILDRRFENDLPFYARHQIAVIPYQPLKGGLLSGRYRRDKARNEEGLIAGWKPAVTDEDLDKIEALAALAEEAGATLAEYALAWDLAQPAVTSVIVGARGPEELESALKAATLCIPAEHLARIDHIAPGPQKPQPRFERS